MLRQLCVLTLAALATASSAVSTTSSTSTESTSKSTTSKSTTSKSTQSTSTYPQLIPTVQLSIPTEDSYYNAIMTDASGSELGLRLDFLQPDVWFANALAMSDCYSVYGLQLTSSASAAASASADDAACYLYGAYTPDTATTVTSGSVVSVSTDYDLWTTAEPTSLAYPDGIVADGVQYTGNLTMGVLGDRYLQLDDFAFGLIDDTNVYAGGLGLGASDSGLGLLDALVRQGVVPGLGYSTYFSDYADNSTGHLILGAVNKLYYSSNMYLFPRIAYEGWSDGSQDLRPLPIVPLDSIALYNPVSDKSVSLYSNSSIAMMLDPRSSYSYLPWDSIIELAVQTNAYYSLALDLWIVRCSDFEDSQATVNFTFGPLTVPVPLSLMLLEAYYGDSYLYFSDGTPACFLAILPMSEAGSYTLGLPFITEIYFAMDVEGGNIGMAVKKSNVNVAADEENPKSAVNGTFEFPASNETLSASVGYIMSGTIPFATTVANSNNLTLTFSTTNYTNTEVIPSRFSAVVIKSGEIYVTVTDNTLATTDSASASAASAHTTKSGGTSFKHSYYETPHMLYVILLLGGFIGVCLA